MKLGPYEIEGELGRGGMGTVYRGRGPAGETVAVKVLARRDLNALARFAREERLLAQLGEAEGFVKVLARGESAEGAFIVMPLVGGGTLAERIARGPLPVAEALRIGRALAAAIGRAHALGVIHRDLKPANVLFTEAGEPLVADLGIAKHFRDDTPGASRSVELSQTREARGTVGYMPPEQMADSKSVGPPADVFALGAIVYEMLTGEPAFTGATVLELGRRVADGSYEAVRSRRPETPAWLVGVIERALSVEPSARFEDGAALARALESGATERGGRRTVAAVLSVAALALGGALFGRSAIGGREATVGPAVPRSPATAAPNAEQLLADLAHGTSASEVLARARALPPDDSSARVRRSSVQRAAARAYARELLRAIAVGRTTEESARALLGADVPRDFAEALGVERVRRSLELWREPAYEDAIHRIQKLAAWSGWTSEPLPDPSATAAAVASCIEQIDESNAAPHREERLQPTLGIMTRLLDAATTLAHALGDDMVQLRGAILCSRARWNGPLVGQPAMLAEARALDASRLSPETFVELHGSLISAAINDAVRATDPERALRGLLDLHRRATARGGFSSFRARASSVQLLDALCALAVELAEVTPDERGALLREARAAFEASERQDKTLFDQDLFRGRVIVERRCVRWILTRAEGDRAVFEKAGDELAGAIERVDGTPSSLELLLVAQWAREQGRLDMAARLVANQAADIFLLGRDREGDRQLLKLVLALERHQPGAREALEEFVTGLKTRGGLVAPRLLRDAEALLAR